MRTKTQELSVTPQVDDAFHVSSTDISDPFADLAIDGVNGLGVDGQNQVKTDANGVKFIDFDSSTFFVPLINFKTGATGSSAVVTITGVGFDGADMTETVTMPGADSDVQATKLFKRVTSMTIDGAYTNLEVGIKDEVDQFSKWLTFDSYENPFTVFLDLLRVTNGGTLDIELTSDDNLYRTDGLDPNSVDTYLAVSPFGTGITASQRGLLTSQVGIAGQTANLPFLAARLRHTAGTAGKWRARFTQSGGYR